MALDYLMRKYILFPLEQNKFSEDCLPQPIICKFPDFSLTFQVLYKFPWPSTKFPDLEKISFSRYFSLTGATLLYTVTGTELNQKINKFRPAPPLTMMQKKNNAYISISLTAGHVNTDENLCRIFLKYNAQCSVHIFTTFLEFT